MIWAGFMLEKLGVLHLEPQAVGVRGGRERERDWIWIEHLKPQRQLSIAQPFFLSSKTCL